MPTIRLSPKQKKSIREAHHSRNLWVGAIRSGKTFASEIAFWDAINGPILGDIMFVGVSRSTIQRNVLEEFYTKFLGCRPPSDKVGKDRIKGRNIYFVGAHNESAVRDIKGATLAFAYVDELTCIPEAVYKELIGRLSVPGARLYATCNPEGPVNWVKKTLVDRANELDLVYWNFLLDDNPSLDEIYKENLKKEYAGSHWYKRLILGEWAAASGAIYDGFCEDNVYTERDSNVTYYIAGIDRGTINATCCLIASVNPHASPAIHVEAEYYYDSMKRGRSKSDSELAMDIKNFIGWRQLDSLFVPPDAVSLKIELSNLGLPVSQAKDDVLPGIQIVNRFIYNKNLAIHKSCTNLIEQMQSYQWDPKSLETGRDKVLKENDHACFCGSTQIAGIGEIKNAKLGDEVFTRKGFKKITSILERREECFCFFIAGRNVYCTGDHPFFTLNGGWKKACDLIQSDIIVTVKIGSNWENTENLKKYRITGKYTDDIQMLQHFLKEPILNAEEGICIETFGNLQMGEFREDFIYITSTETPLIIVYPILNVYLQSSMQKNIQRIVEKSFQTNAGKKLPNGTNQKKGKSGIKTMLKKCSWENGKRENLSACGVKQNTKPQKDMHRNFVQITVDQPKEKNLVLIMSLENAYDVLESFVVINTCSQNIAPYPVPRKSIGKRNVYNLSVDKAGEYFAEGILVHNCDALRYLCYSKFPTGEILNPWEKMSASELRKYINDDGTNWDFYK